MFFIDEFFIELNNKAELENFPSLMLLNLPKEFDLKKGNLNRPNNPNQIYVFATTMVSNGNLKINNNTKFDVIFPRMNPIDFIECDIILKYININPRYEIDYLPGGYTGICLLEFKNEIPMILINKLAVYEISNKPLVSDILILTQKPILEKIIDLKQKNN